MKSNILRSLTALLVLMFAFTANTFSQSANVKSSSTKLTKKVLIVLSSADTWTRADGSKYPTGYWTEEFVDVHKEFVDAGYKVDIATPNAPWLLASTLRKYGANYTCSAKNWGDLCNG